jgi:hypothetical protein
MSRKSYQKNKQKRKGLHNRKGKKYHIVGQDHKTYVSPGRSGKGKWQKQKKTLSDEQRGNE